jgi:C1A family cysteine protease
VDCGWVQYQGHIGTPEGTGCPKQRCSPCPYDGEPLPAEFSWTSWRGVNWMSPVKDQGSCGSCWAFGSVGGVEAAYNIEKEYATDLGRPDFSEQWLVSGHPGMGGSCSGGHAAAALADIQVNGITKENYFPYQSAICGGFGGACNASCTGSADPVWGLTSSCARPFARTETSSTLYNSIKITGFTPVESGNVADVKRAIMCHGPLVVSSINWKHVVVLVGWSDYANYSYTDGSWLVKNSWGVPSYNNSFYFHGVYKPAGYTWIAYTGEDYSDIVPATEYKEGYFVLTGGGMNVVSRPYYINAIKGVT